MRFKIVAAAASMALLASCGGGEPATDTTGAAPETAVPAPSTADAPQTDVGAADMAPASPSASPTPEAAPGVTSSARALASASPSAVPVAAASAAQAAPPPEFAVCRSCHSVEKGKNGVGPTLFAIAGSKAGDVPGYAFSPALKASGIVWTPANIDKWLQGPMKMVPGTKMVIAVPDAARRKAIVSYLETLK